MKNPFLLVLVLVLLLQISPLLAYSRIDCSFDTGSCGYTQTHANSWVRTDNKTTYPGHDHTSGSGYWLSTVPSSNYSGTQEFAVLSTYLYSTNETNCLSFWYASFNLEKAQFAVKINHNPNTFNAQMLWNKQTPKANNIWIQAYVEIPPQSSYFYVIWQTFISNDHEILGIDDVTFSPGACPPSPTSRP